MNAEQKKRAVELIADFEFLNKENEIVYHAHKMAWLLQELIDAPEPEPVAWMYEDNFGTHFTGDYSEIANNLEVLSFTSLYIAPPAPSVPDVLQMMQPSKAQLTQILNELDKCFAGESKREFLRVWIRDWTAHKLALAGQKEPPADVARDAERLRQFEKWANAGYAPCLAYDDDGHWQISFDGFNAVGEPLGRVTIFTEKDDWHDSVGEAIDTLKGIEK